MHKLFGKRLHVSDTTQLQGWNHVRGADEVVLNEMLKYLSKRKIGFVLKKLTLICKKVRFVRVLFGVILFSCIVTRASAFLLRAVNVCLALIVCDVALVLCVSSFVQKSLFDWHHSCCFIHIQCMSLDRSLWTRRISSIKPSIGHKD